MHQFLSIRQPHAHAIMAGEKRVENRSWKTNHRGFLWIHAGISTDTIEEEHWEDWCTYYQSLPSDPEKLSRGAILGSVELVDCIPAYQARKSFPDQREFVVGPMCFILANPRILKEPIPWKGNVGMRGIDLSPTDQMFCK